MIRFFIFSVLLFVPTLGKNYDDLLQATTPVCADLICSYDILINKDPSKQISVSISMGKPSKIIGNFDISYNDDDMGFQGLPPVTKKTSISLFSGKMETIKDVSVGGISYKMLINRGDVKVSQDDDGKFTVHWCPFIQIVGASLSAGPRFCFIYKDGFRKQFSFEYDGSSRRVNKFWMNNVENESGNEVKYFDKGKQSMEKWNGNRFTID